jgi:hypothetical protein
MPFDLFVTRPTRRFGPDDLRAAMAGAPAVEQSPGVHWVTHPDGGEWCAVDLTGDGRIRLSTSYAHHRFLRNFPDLFDLAVRMARALGGRVVEEVGGEDVTDADLDELLAPDGPYVELQAGTWGRTRIRMASEALAGLEYPLAGADLVSEYCLFHVTPARAVEDRVIGAAAAKMVRTELRPAGPGRWMLLRREPERPIARLLRRPDERWQIWPVWGHAPFSMCALAVVHLAELLHRVAGGTIEFLGRPYDDALRAAVRARLDGLGVDFYRWTTTLP